MIDEKKINEAALDYLETVRKDYKASEPGNECHSYYDYPIEEETIEEQFIDNFKAGANWMAQEFKKHLWHDRSEKPTKSCNILFEYEKDKFYAEYHNKDKVAWQNIRTIRWCDIDDILPKEGGEE